MSSKSPIFPMPEPQPLNLSDYGFDPQMDYFQVLEEARKHKKETSRSIDALHFKLQKDEDSKITHKIMKKKRWWKNTLLLFKWKKWNVHSHSHHHDTLDVRASISGPIYITESRATPYRTTCSRPSSGPLAGTLTIPYLSLRELNMEHHHHRVSTSSMPIYLVT